MEQAMTTTTGPQAPPAAESPRETHTVSPVAVVLVLTALLALVLTAFALPAIKSAPHDVPIGVAGPPQAAAGIEQALASRAAGAWAVTGYADEVALAQAIRDRDVYGGLALTPTGPKVLTAPAGSPVVAQALTALASGLGQEQGQVVPVETVVPLPAGDPRGVGLGAALLPLLIGAVAPVVAMARVVRGSWRRLVGVLAVAVTAGAALAAMLHWFGAFEGSYLLDAAAMAAVIAAMGTALLGLYSVAGFAGLGLGVALFMLVGNPLSGLATAPEFLPAFWSTLGAWLPPGAGGQLLRSAAYFDGAGAAGHLVMLGAWFVLGLLLVAAGSRRAAVAVSSGP
jgi:hypothetical protein